MLLLDTSTKLQLVLAAAHASAALEIVAAWLDITGHAPGLTTQTSNGATDVDVVAAPASGLRAVKSLTVFNSDSAAATVTLKTDNGGTERRVFKATLAVGDSLIYEDGRGWGVHDASGNLKTVAAGASSSVAVVEGADAQRILQSPLGGSGTFLGLTGVAYWVYLGRVFRDIVAKHVEFHVSTIGAGAQTAEVALASSPTPPNKGSQTLTKLSADGTVDALTGTGVKRNTSALNTLVVAGTHLWAGIRTAMATTQPTYIALGPDMNQGQVLSTAAAGALTGAGPWTGSKIAAATTGIVPDLRVVLD